MHSNRIFLFIALSFLLFIPDSFNILPASAQGGGACNSFRCSVDKTCCVDLGGDPYCANLTNSHTDCGSCGNACYFTERCIQGECRCMGDDGTQKICTDEEVCFHRVGCVNITTDASNCGDLGKLCDPGEYCLERSCVPVCPSPHVMCNDQCTDIQNNNQHCGSCGVACPSGSLCKNGSCEVHCADNESICNGECVDLSSDEQHCGGCNSSCEAYERCVATSPFQGQCRVVCNEALSLCDESCKDLNTDADNCGGCGNQCPVGSICNGNGQCAVQCAPGLTECSESCVNLETDDRHCGGCGGVCPPGSVCSNGGCILNCPVGMGICNGTCVDYGTDSDNCGGCGVSCPLAQHCDGTGRCVDFRECAPGFTFCNDRCANLDSDSNNCGTCGHSCPTGERCNGSGQCEPSCSSDQLLCGADGCVDAQNDERHCGGCDTLCDGSQSCIAGECKTTSFLQQSAASTLFIPFWSLEDAETDFSIHTLRAIDFEVIFFNRSGEELIRRQFNSSSNATTTIQLRNFRVLLESGAGSALIRLVGNRVNNDATMMAEAHIEHIKDKNLVLVPHVSLKDGVWTRFRKGFVAPIHMLEADSVKLFCPKNALADLLKDAGKFVGEPALGFASGVELKLRNESGQVLAETSETCQSITEINLSSLFVLKDGSKPKLDGLNGSITLSPIVKLSPTTGNYIEEDAVFLGFQIVYPAPDKKGFDKGSYTSGYFKTKRQEVR